MFSIAVDTFAKRPYHYLHKVPLPLTVTVHGKPSYYVVPVTKVPKTRDGLTFLRSLVIPESKKVIKEELQQYDPKSICPKHNSYRAACGCLVG